MRNASNQIVGTFPQRDLPLGAGGFVSGMDISTDGQRMVCWCDVYGCYVRNVGDKRWTPMFDASGNIPAADYQPSAFPNAAATNWLGYSDGLGGAGCRIAPSDKNVIYSLWNGYLYKSIDGGKTSKRTNFGPRRMAANYKRYNRRLDIHPTDPNTVIVGTSGEGVWCTTDGGTTWALIAGIPPTRGTGVTGLYYSTDGGATKQSFVNGKTTVGSGFTSAPSVVYSGGSGSGGAAHVTVSNGAIDGIFIDTIGADYDTHPTITLSGGEGSGVTLWPYVEPGLYKDPYMVLIDEVTPSNVYIFVTATQKGLAGGLYRSTTGVAGPFAAVPGGQTEAIHLYQIPGTNSLLIGDVNSKLIYKLTGDTWTSVPLSYGAASYAADSADKTKIFAFNDNGVQYVSLDGGATYNQFDNRVWTGGEVSWITHSTNLSLGQVVADPSTPHRFYVAHGNGVARFDWDSAAGNTKFFDYSAGIEVLIPTRIISVPGRTGCMVTCWDRQIFNVTDLDHWTNQYTQVLPADKPDVQYQQAFMGKGIDYAGDNPDFMVAIAQGYGQGFSVDGGVTFRPFAEQPTDGYMGTAAVSTQLNFMITPDNNGTARYTKDGGKTWKPVKLDGVNPTSGWCLAYYLIRNNVTADKTRPGHFAAVYTTIGGPTGNDNPLGGLWFTSDGGDTWARNFAGVIGRGFAANVPYGEEQRQFWNCQLSYVHERSGEMLYTTHADQGPDPLRWSQDDGISWVDVSSRVRDVTAFGTAPPAPGQSRPACWFNGKVDGALGLYVTFDWFATIAKVANYPNGSLAGVFEVCPDVNVFGQCFVGQSGNGACVVSYADIATGH